MQTLIPWLGKMRPSLKSVGERERTVPPTWVPTSGGILLDVQIWGGGWDSASLTSSQVVLRLESLEEQGTGAPHHECQVGEHLGRSWYHGDSPRGIPSGSGIESGET